MQLEIFRLLVKPETAFELRLLKNPDMSFHRNNKKALAHQAGILRTL